MYSLCFWFLSFKIMFLRLIHVVVCISSNPFLFIVEYYSIVWIYHNLFSHSNVDEHLCCFQFGAVMNKLLLTFIYKSSCGHMFSFLFGKNLGMKWLCHMVNMCLTYMKLPKCFPKRLHYFIFLSEMCMN